MNTNKTPLFTQSENFTEEYCAAIVKVGKITDIDGADNLKQATIDGFSVVVNKNDIHEGDVVIYCKMETQLNHEFLSVNNMYEIGERHLNANYQEVQKLIDDGRKDEAKLKTGYFNKNGRVRMIRLRGCPSIGVLMKLESLAVWDCACENVNLEDYVTYTEDGECIPYNFDTVNGKEFIKVFVPPIPEAHRKKDKLTKLNKRIARFNRMIPGQFSFHYDTQQLESNIWKIKPDDIIDVSVKFHGTSNIVSNILVKKPIYMDAGKRWWNRKMDRKIKALRRIKPKTDRDVAIKTSVISHCERKKVKNYAVGYGNVYASRRVILNEDINLGERNGYYKDDVWKRYSDLISKYLDKGMTVYGEIVGYETGSNSMIQKQYDYGCNPGENYMMPYRITMHEDDRTKDWNVRDVVRWTERMVKDHEELKGRLVPMVVLYHGKAKDMYQDLDPEQHWRENFLQRMKDDKDRLGMELDEPLCKTKVPREGVCIRIVDDPVAECFKLKTNAYREKERKNIDKGDVDREIAERY